MVEVLRDRGAGGERGPSQQFIERKFMNTYYLYNCHCSEPFFLLNCCKISNKFDVLITSSNE